MYLLDRKIPDDISLITFEDPQVTQYLTPPHTTVSQNIPKLAETVAELALGTILKKGNSTIKNVTLDNQLIIRESVKKIS
jgi:LacI family transcriptional regulator